MFAHVRRYILLCHYYNKRYSLKKNCSSTEIKIKYKQSYQKYTEQLGAWKTIFTHLTIEGSDMALSSSSARFITRTTASQWLLSKFISLLVLFTKALNSNGFPRPSVRPRASLKLNSKFNWNPIYARNKFISTKLNASKKLWSSLRWNVISCIIDF